MPTWICQWIPLWLSDDDLEYVSPASYRRGVPLGRYNPPTGLSLTPLIPGSPKNLVFFPTEIGQSRFVSAYHFSNNFDTLILERFRFIPALVGVVLAAVRITRHPRIDPRLRDQLPTRPAAQK